MSKNLSRRAGGCNAPSSLLRSLSARRSLSLLELTAMVLPPYAALDALHRGAGCPALLGTLAEYAVFSELLATRGHMPESISVIQHAQTALCEFSQRGPATLWALPEAAYDALTAWLECYVTQAEHAGMTGILLAHAALPEFVERRPMVMKVAA